MKLITASILLIGASAKPTPSRHRDAKSIARLRALRKIAAHQQSKKKKHNLRRTNTFFDMFQSPASENVSSCDTTCDDDDMCKSFMFSDDLMPHCDTQCIPQAQMKMCMENCSTNSVGSVATPNNIQTVSVTNTEDASTSTVTAEQKKKRLSMLVDEYVCGECKFFQCCMDGTGTSMGMGGTMGMGHAVDSHNDNEMDQSSQEQMGMMGQSNMDSHSNMGQVETRNYGMCKSFEPDLDLMMPDIGGLLPEDMHEWGMSGGTTGEDWGAWDGDAEPEPASATGVSAPAQGVSSGNSVGWSGTETATGLTFLGQMVDSVECPDTCGRSFLCHTILHGNPNYSDVVNACEDGCLPTVSSCEESCSQDAGMPEEACGACRFFQCCGKSSEETMPEVKQFGGDGSKFGSCLQIFPELETLFPSGGVWNGGMSGGPSWGNGGSIVTGTGAVSDPSNSASSQGSSVLQDLMDSMECSGECPDNLLCMKFVDGEIYIPDESFIEKACNDGCLPASGGCENFCGNQNGPAFMSEAYDTACELCTFLKCCSGNHDGNTRFGACKAYYPKPMQDWDPSYNYQSGPLNWNYTTDQVFEDLEDALEDLSNAFAGIEAALSGIVENVVGDISIPEFCPGGEDSCSVEGFCDVFNATTPNFDLPSIDYEAVCSSDAFYICGPEDFEKMCATRCSSAIASVTETEGSSAPVIELGGPVAVAEERMGLLDLPICHLCNIAKCCNTTEDKESENGFMECALYSIASVETTGSNQPVIEFESSQGTGSSTTVSEEDVLPSSGAAAENSDKDPGSGNNASSLGNKPDTNSGGPPDSAAGGTAGDSDGDGDNSDGDTTSEPTGGVEPSGSEQTGDAAKPTDPTLEASELNDPLDSGSYTSGLSVFTALASIGLLYSVLF